MRASRIGAVNMASLPAFGPLATLSPALLPEGEGSVESPPERGGSWVGTEGEGKGCDEGRKYRISIGDAEFQHLIHPGYSKQLRAPLTRRNHIAQHTLGLPKSY